MRTGRVYQVVLSVEFIGAAEHVEELEYSDDELEGLTEAEIEEMVNVDARNWAENYIYICAQRII